MCYSTNILAKKVADTKSQHNIDLDDSNNEKYLLARKLSPQIIKRAPQKDLLEFYKTNLTEGYAHPAQWFKDATKWYQRCPPPSKERTNKQGGLDIHGITIN